MHRYQHAKAAISYGCRRALLVAPPHLITPISAVEMSDGHVVLMFVRHINGPYYLLVAACHFLRG